MGSMGSAIGGIAEGVFGGRKKRKEERKSRRRQRNVANQLEAISAINQRIFAEKGAPAIEKFLAQAQQPAFNPQQEADLASAGVERFFQQEKARERRGLERFGLNPSDIRFRTALDKFSRAKGAVEVGLRNQARRVARDLNFGRLTQAANFAAGVGGAAVAPLGVAGGIHGEQRSMAAQQGENRRADMYAGLSSLNQILSPASLMTGIPGMPGIPAGSGITGVVSGAALTSPGTQLPAFGGEMDFNTGFARA